MTSLLSRSRARAGHALAGGLLTVGWLLPPGAAASTHGLAAGTSAVAPPGARPTPAAAAPDGDRADADGTSTGELVPPLVTVTVTGALAAYGFLRRRRRARTRTTPGGAPGRNGPAG